MRCKACDYPLWNLRTRSCPECGKPFLPSEFEFVTDSVRFCCPHCAQTYYGTGDKGHLVPASFQCVKCARQISMDEMVLLPTEGVHEELTRVDAVPWLDRPRRGWIKAWFGTVGMSLAAPVRLAGALPADTGTMQAGGFALLTGSLYTLLGCLIVLVPIAIMALRFGGAGRGLATVLGVLLAVPFCLVALMLLWAGAAHVFLRLTGKTEHGFSRTLVCLCYSSGANVLMAIPCMGPYFLPLTWVWWSISAAFMLAPFQRVSRLRAFLATMLPPVIVLVSAILILILAIIPGVQSSLVSARASSATAMGSFAVPRAVAALQRYAAVNNGASPPHALVLLAENRLQPTELLSVDSIINQSSGKSGGLKLLDFQSLSPEEQAATVQSAVQSLPQGTVAHRAGDVVFTYHGIDLSPGSTADPGLWLAIWAPLPGTSGAPSPSAPQTVIVGTAGGIVTIPLSSLPAKLLEQNTLRASAGLAPLPDPFAVTEKAPGVAPAPLKNPG